MQNAYLVVLSPLELDYRFRPNRGQVWSWRCIFRVFILIHF